MMDHNPWSDDLDPDPNNNFTTFEFTNNGGSRISFSTRSFQRVATGRHVRLDPEHDDLLTQVT